MNARINLSDIVAALKLALPAITNIDSGYAVNYLRDFGATYPAIWVLAQRAKAQGQDADYSQLARQHFNVEFVVRCVVQRYVDGSTNAEPALNALMNSVTSALYATQPPGCETSLVITGTQDAQPGDTVLYADVTFGTVVTYIKGS